MSDVLRATIAMAYGAALCGVVAFCYGFGTRCADRWFDRLKQRAAEQLAKVRRA